MIGGAIGGIIGGLLPAANALVGRLVSRAEDLPLDDLLAATSGASQGSSILL